MVLQEWGKSGNIDQLALKWHVPNAAEKQFATEVLQAFLVPELQRVDAHTQGSHTLSR